MPDSKIERSVIVAGFLALFVVLLAEGMAITGTFTQVGSRQPSTRMMSLEFRLP
jgi:hypothetical protein